MKIIKVINFKLNFQRTNTLQRLRSTSINVFLQVKYSDTLLIPKIH